MSGLFEHGYPYTDSHEINLSWVILKVKELAEAWAQVQQDWTDEQAAFANLQSWIENYFNNLDVQTEINVKLDAMVAAGTMSELIAPYVASGLPAEVADQIGAVVAAQIGPVVAAQISAVVADQLPAVAAAAAATEVSAWLAAHVDPDTGYVIDDSLTVQGAAADAKATGDKITEIKSALSQLEGQTYNLVMGRIKDRTVSSNGKLGLNAGTDVFKANVEEGKIYRVLTSDNNLIFAFFTSDPFEDDAQSYNSSRTIQNLNTNIVAPITGYIAIRTNSSYTTPQVSEGYIPRPYIQPVTAKDLTARSAIDIVNENFSPYSANPIETSNKYINYSNGVESNFTGLSYFTYDVLGGSTLTYKYTNTEPNAIGLAFYDASGTFISGAQALPTSQTVSVPDSAVTLKATALTSDSIVLYGYVDVINSRFTNDLLVPKTEPLTEIHDGISMLSMFLHVGCIGDSLASGESYSNDGGTTQAHDLYDFSWGQFLARQTGNTYYNFSRGGLSTKTWMESTYATQCFDGDHDCEAYIIGLGQNDYNAHMTIGTSADIDFSDYTQNADTFYGNYAKIIQRLQILQPKAKIFVITDPNPYVNRDGYNAVIRDMATLFTNVYVVDLQQYGTRYYNSSILRAQMRASHYNAYGYKIFSLMIANYIDWIILSNPSEFTQVEFIGTEWTWTD